MFICVYLEEGMVCGHKEQLLTGTRERSVIPWSRNYKKYPNVLVGN